MPHLFRKLPFLCFSEQASSLFQSAVAGLKEGKRKSFEFRGPKRDYVKPTGKIQAHSPHPPIGCLPGKHLRKLRAFKTLT